jgi:hypothetical protein
LIDLGAESAEFGGLERIGIKIKSMIKIKRKLSFRLTLDYDVERYGVCLA